jgi:hypothetical protein
METIFGCWAVAALVVHSLGRWNSEEAVVVAAAAVELRCLKARK